MRKFFLVSLCAVWLICGLTGCADQITAANLSKPPKINEPDFSALNHHGYTRSSDAVFDDWFNKIVISGNINADIKTQQPKDELVFMGSQNMRRSFSTKISNHV